MFLYNSNHISRPRAGYRFLATLAVGLLWIGLSSCAFGLFGGGAERAREDDVDQTVSVLTDRLQLTAEQADQIRPVIEHDQEARSQIVRQDQVRVNSGGTSMGAQLGLLRQDTEERLAGILTPEQLGEYRKFRDQEEAAEPPPPQRRRRAW
jgi:hypothetical protein